MLSYKKQENFGMNRFYCMLFQDSIVSVCAISSYFTEINQTCLPSKIKKCRIFFTKYQNKGKTSTAGILTITTSNTFCKLFVWALEVFNIIYHLINCQKEELFVRCVMCDSPVNELRAFLRRKGKLYSIQRWFMLAIFNIVSFLWASYACIFACMISTYFRTSTFHHSGNLSNVKDVYRELNDLPKTL